MQEKLRPWFVWVAVPCTAWSSIQNLNRSRKNFARRLARKRRMSRQMVRHLLPMLIACVKNHAHIYFEWPRRCHGWTIPELDRLHQVCASQCRPLFTANIDGCMYGLKSLCGKYFLKKAWRVLTTDAGFAKRVGNLCTGTHRHVPIHGRNTSHSARYPKAMAVAIAAHWKWQVRSVA